MPQYSYLAKSLDGEEKTGFREAADSHQLARILRQEGLILVKAEEKKEKTAAKKSLQIFSLFGGVSLPDRLMFTRNLQVMISSGLPLPKALTILKAQTKNKRFQKALDEIGQEITKGKNLSEALEKFPNIFNELFRSMIKVGEETGTMEGVLKTLTQQMEKEHELQSKIKSAMVYPAVVICAMIGIGFLMLIMVVPKLSQTFEDLGAELPFTTKLVIWLGNFLSAKWYFVILILVGFFFLFRFLIKIKQGKMFFDKFLLKIPVISQIIKKTNTAHTARTLASLISAGVPIVRSLEIVSETMGNYFYQRALNKATEVVKKGGKLSEAISPYQDIYPTILVQMVAVGEETGETSTVLEKLAEFFEEEVGNAAKNLVSVIEPVLMLVIGAIIGFFAISMVQPMYSMLGAI